MASVIYVDLSSDSEEEGPPNAKKARREENKMATTANSSKFLNVPKESLSAAEINTTQSMTALTETVIGTYRSMHIPSGITVTKHNNCNGNLNNNINNNNTKNSNSKNSLNKNSLKCKTLQLESAVTNVSLWSKAPTTTLATITSVPSPQMVLTKASQLAPAHQKHAPTIQKQTMLVQQKALLKQSIKQREQNQKVPTSMSQQQQQQQQRTLEMSMQKTTAMLQLQELQQIKLKASTSMQQHEQKTLTLQNTTQKPLQAVLQLQKVPQQNTLTSTLKTPKLLLQNQKHHPSMQRSLQALLITQKLPLKTNSQTQKPLASLQKTALMQQKSFQLLPPAQIAPPPAHGSPARSIPNEKQMTAVVETPPPPPPANHSMSTFTPVAAPPLLPKITSMPMLSKPLVMTSAARHLPYKIKPIAGTATTLLASTTQPIHSVTAGATPPLRLLATPPHCAAALNEPLLLNLPPTTSITPQLTPTTTPPPPPTASAIAPLHSFPSTSISPANKPLPKRVQPITVLKKSDEQWRKHLAQQQEHQKPKENPTIVLVESPPTTPPTEKIEQEQERKKKSTASPAKSTATTEVNDKIFIPEPVALVPLVPEYTTLLQLCRELDTSKDMERLIEIKLLKYYYSVHESFVRSRGFRKQLLRTIECLRNEPDMIYVHLKCVVEELKVRRKAKAVELLEEEAEPESNAQQKSQDPVAAQLVTKKTAKTSPESTTGNKRTDERIRKLNRTLYTITKRISALEEADVDWNDDDDSSYLQVERFKKRACQIYEKICDLTGESKSAHRQMKQPILFRDSPYRQFNRTLSAFVNRMHEFPDYHDVLQLLEHCNKEKGLGLVTFEMKRIAHDAFVKVGRLLQARRKTDLYETVTHFTANSKDPAATDASLLAKLNENNKKKTKISDILERFAREQDFTAEEQREARIKEKQLHVVAESAVTNYITSPVVDDDKPCTSAQAAQAQEKKQTNGVKTYQFSKVESDSSDDGNANDETDEDVDAFVDSINVNCDLSDVESASETEEAVKTPTPTAPVIVNNVKRVKTSAAHSRNITIYNHDVNNENVVAKTALNGQTWDAPAAHLLKIMSVSSLNATISSSKKNYSGCPEHPKHQLRKSRQDTFINTEIVISDEEL